MRRLGGKLRAVVGRCRRLLAIPLCAAFGAGVLGMAAARAADITQAYDKPGADGSARTGGEAVVVEPRAPVNLRPAGDLADSLEAGSVEIDPDGVAHASGGVTLTITSLVENATVVAEADEAVYNTRTGEADLSGGVSVRLVERDFTVRCERFLYDPGMERVQVSGLQVQLPLEALTGEAELPTTSSLGQETHFHNMQVRSIYLAAGEARYDLTEDNTFLVISDVRLTHNPRPDPDLYFTAREVRLAPGKQATFDGIALYLSGIRVLGWPSYTRQLRRAHQPFSFAFPRVKIDREVGVAWKQGVTGDFGALKADALLDYSPEYGLLAHTFAYVEPVAGTKLGVQYGSKSEVDLARQNIERRDKYNVVYRQRFRGRVGAIQDGWLSLEYGRTVLHTRGLPKEDILPQRIEDTRFLADTTLEFPLLRLSDQLFLATGANFKYIRYMDAEKEYSAAGGEAGLVWRQGGYDSYVLGKANEIEGEAVFPFDEVREREVDFALSLRLHPSWRHTVYGVYDFDREEFNTLQVGALKRQKTYEVGLYYDFARENAGVEFGLLFD